MSRCLPYPQPGYEIKVHDRPKADQADGKKEKSRKKQKKRDKESKKHSSDDKSHRRSKRMREHGDTSPALTDDHVAAGPDLVPANVSKAATAVLEVPETSRERRSEVTPQQVELVASNKEMSVAMLAAKENGDIGDAENLESVQNLIEPDLPEGEECLKEMKVLDASAGSASSAIGSEIDGELQWLFRSRQRRRESNDMDTFGTSYNTPQYSKEFNICILPYVTRF